MKVPSGSCGARGWMARFICLGSAVLLLGSAGCATIMHGHTQQVNIITTPSGAECSVGGATVKSPAVIQLSRGRNHDVVCSLAGFSPLTARITYKSSLWWLGNIANGIIPGMLVDIYGGGIGNLSPTVLRIELKESPRS